MKIRINRRTEKNHNRINYRIIAFFLLLSITVSFMGCGQGASKEKSTEYKAVLETEMETTVRNTEDVTETTVGSTEDVTGTRTQNDTKASNELKAIPKFDDEPYVVVDNNQPDFSKKEITSKSFETYSRLDTLGRCGVALACVGKDIMPTEKRGGIGMVKPTGWHTVKYEFVDGKYLYNRCHLIGYQLTGENANERNLITGTRYMNVDGMLPFEDMVADYVKETENHVMYRVTPVYKGSNLLASGVQMEGYSVEDKGKGISFNVYCYNAQPGVKIDYKTGNSNTNGKIVEETSKKKDVEKDNSSSSTEKTQYILNLNTHKFHYPDCGSVKIMSESNKGTYTGSRKDLIGQGYEPCGNCNP